MPDLFLDQDVAGAQDLFVIAFGEDDLLGVHLRLVDHGARDFVGLAEPALELGTVGFEINWFLGDSGAHRGLGDGGGFPHQHTGIEGFGDQIFTAELQTLDAVRAADGVGDIFFCQIGESVGCSELHFFVDGGGTNVEGSTENEGESENVVDLVGIVGASSGDDDITAAGLSLGVSNFGVGVGHGEDDRIGGHGAHHVGSDRTLHGETGKDVGADDSFSQRTQLGFLREALFVFVHSFSAAVIDDSFCVAEENVFPLHTEADVVLRAGDAGGSGAVEDDSDFTDVFADDFESIQQSGTGDDGGSVLVVVKNRNLHRLAEGFLDLETVGGFDVFEIDPAEGGFEKLANLDDLFGIVTVDFNVENVDVGEALEEDGFPFHDRLTSKSADVTQT